MRTRSASRRAANVPRNRAYVDIIVSAQRYRATRSSLQSTRVVSEQTFTSRDPHTLCQSVTAVPLRSSVSDSSFRTFRSDPSRQENRATTSDGTLNGVDDVTTFLIDAAEPPTRVVVHPSDLWPFASDTSSEVIMSASPSRGAPETPSPTRRNRVRIPLGSEQNPHSVPPFLSWQRSSPAGPPRTQIPKLEAPKFPLPAHLVVTPGRNDTDAQRQRQLEIHQEQMQKLFERKHQAEARLAEIEMMLSDPSFASVDSTQVNTGTSAADEGETTQAGSAGVKRKPPKLGPCGTELISESGDGAECAGFISTFPEEWVKAAKGLLRQDTEPI